METNKAEIDINKIEEFENEEFEDSEMETRALKYLTADIVIYGGSFAGCAAAMKASEISPDKSIVLIITDPIPYKLVSGYRKIKYTTKSLGGIGTVGGQNYFDIRYWSHSGTSTLAQAGSFPSWLNYEGQAYNTENMSNKLAYDLEYGSNGNINILAAYDIDDFETQNNPYRITSIYIKGIKRNTNTNYVEFSGTTRVKVTGTVFVDASEDGKLTRIVNFGGTTGRYDWPAGKLDTGETVSDGQARQQAATLMFKITNVSAPSAPDPGSNSKTVGHVTYTFKNGLAMLAYSDRVVYKDSQSAFYSFNEDTNVKNAGFALKPFNMARDGANTDEWWINALLVFNVDGRACKRDEGNSSIYPQDMRSDYRDVDEAYADAVGFINNNKSYIENALRSYTGLGTTVEIVTDEEENAIVGDVLYLRETVHMAIYSYNRANGTEETNYQLGSTECNWSGEIPTGGYDTGNYSTRIGLNYYWSDINAYKRADLQNTSGAYIWGEEIGQILRPDMWVTGSTPLNPVYVPYNALTTKYVANLLIPGYAVGASSFAWSECRVIPNLCVLGDAAGVAAGYAVNNNKHPLQFTSTDITAVQNLLVTLGARINK